MNQQSRLEEAYQALSSQNNGGIVAKTMAEILKFALEPKNEHLISSCNQLLEKIVMDEAELLDRTELQIREQGKTLQPYLDALYASGDEECNTFLAKYAEGERDSIAQAALEFSHSRGNLSQFRDWVLGQEIFLQDPETMCERGFIEDGLKPRH